MRSRGFRFDFGVDGGRAAEGRRSGRWTGGCRREPFSSPREGRNPRAGLVLPRDPPPIRDAEGRLLSSHSRSKSFPRAQAQSRSWADRVRKILPDTSQSRQLRDSNSLGLLRESQREPHRDSMQEQLREEREAPIAHGRWNFPDPRVQLSGTRQHLMSRQRDNNTEVEQEVNEDGWKVVQRRRR